MEAALTWVSSLADQSLALFGLLFLLAFANVYVPPVPIETISLFVGYLSGAGHGNALVMWLAMAGGMAAGSTLLYFLARSQEQRLMRHSFVSRQVSPELLVKVEVWFQRYGLWTIYIGKLLPGMSFATVLASGLFGVPPKRALNAIYLANMLYFSATVAIGRLLGENWQEVVLIGGTLWPWLLGAIALVAIAWLLIKQTRRS